MSKANVYNIVSRLPPQIVEIDAAFDKSPARIQALVDVVPLLRRRSRCFPRSIEMLRTVLEVFADAYNRFVVAKMRFRQGCDSWVREVSFSLLDFL